MDVWKKYKVLLVCLCVLTALIVAAVLILLRTQGLLPPLFELSDKSTNTPAPPADESPAAPDSTPEQTLTPDAEAG